MRELTRGTIDASADNVRAPQLAVAIAAIACSPSGVQPFDAADVAPSSGCTTAPFYAQPCVENGLASIDLNGWWQVTGTRTVNMSLAGVYSGSVFVSRVGTGCGTFWVGDAPVGYDPAPVLSGYSDDTIGFVNLVAARGSVTWSVCVRPDDGALHYFRRHIGYVHQVSADWVLEGVMTPAPDARRTSTPLPSG